MAKSFKIEHLRIAELGDDALMLPLNKPSDDVTMQKWVGLNLRHGRLNNWNDGLKDHLVKQLHDLIKKDYKIRCFIFHTPDKFEKKYYLQLQTLLGTESVIIEESFDAKNYKGLLSKCDFALGSAYHFVLFCLELRIPVIALSGLEVMNDKFRGAYDTVGGSLECISINDFCNYDLVSKSMALLQNANKDIKILINTIKDADEIIISEYKKLLTKHSKIN
jgi:polysaccharide pyruvyl transferase WcaK-like protein